jgi:hypothetical protein
MGCELLGMQHLTSARIYIQQTCIIPPTIMMPLSLEYGTAQGLLTDLPILCTSLRRRQCPKNADPAGHQQRPQTLVCTASQAWPKMGKECLRILLSHGSSILKNIAKRCCFKNVVGSIGPTAAIFVDLQLMHECENAWRSSVAERLRLQYQLTAGKCLNFLAVGWRRRGCHNRTPEAHAW